MRSYFWSVFFVFGLNTEIYGVTPEITPYLDTFHAVRVFKNGELNVFRSMEY